MKPVDQTVFGYPNGNCLLACVASILEVPLADLPHMGPETHDGSWWGLVQGVLQARGHTLVYYVPDGGVEGHRFLDIAPPGYHIACGESPRSILDEHGKNVGHCVVMKDGKLAHDPHPSRAGITSVRDWLLIMPVAQ